MIQNQIGTMQGKIGMMNKKIDQLYEDKLNGILSVEDFERIYISTLDRKKELEATIIELEKQKEETSREVDLKKEVTNFIKARKITREMIVSLVDKITVSEDKEVKIYYKFSILNESSNTDNKVLDIRDCVNF